MNIVITAKPWRSAFLGDVAMCFKVFIHSDLLYVLFSKPLCTNSIVHGNEVWVFKPTWTMHYLSENYFPESVIILGCYLCADEIVDVFIVKQYSILSFVHETYAACMRAATFSYLYETYMGYAASKDIMNNE